MKGETDRATLLYAEDDPDDQLLLRDAVRECGLPVDLRFVASGEELLECLRNPSGACGCLAGQPCIVLLDLNMPGMGGLEVLRRIRADPALRALPVMVLTTSEAREDVQRCHDAGASAYLVKPTTYGEMVEMMRLAGTWWLRLCRQP